MKVLLIATVQSHICQFHRPLVEMLHEHGCEVHVAAKNNLAEKNGLQLDFADRIFDIPFERSPFSWKNLAAYKQLKQIIDNGKYDVVHTNTPVGGIAGRLAARKVRKNGCQVFYTAHGFHFFQGGPKKSWLIYYPIEKFMCRYTDELVTITDEDFQLARNKFRVSVSHIHGIGANTNKYAAVTSAEILELRKALGFTAEQKLIICTGELNNNKNQITAIRAMHQVAKVMPNAILLIAGNGPTHDSLQAAINTLNLQSNVILLGYRTDLDKYVKISNLILSCSKREGLPLNIIEGMLCKKPVVASVNRGHKELIQDERNGYLLSSTDVEGFSAKIIELLDDTALANAFGEEGYMLAQAYTDQAVKLELEQIYQKRQVI